MANSTPEQAVQKQPPKESASPPVPALTTGRRQAFQDLKRGLTDKELASPGAQKLLLEILECAEAEKCEYKEFVALYYEAEKRASVLNEKLVANKVNEAMFGVGVGVGGTILGLAPSFSGQGNNGAICVGVGLALIVGSTLGRIRHK